MVDWTEGYGKAELTYMKKQNGRHEKKNFRSFPVWLWWFAKIMVMHAHKHDNLPPGKLFLRKLFPDSTQKILYFETCFANMTCKRIKPQNIAVQFHTDRR